ncbi:hypothetical protein DY000_02025220 [Brassica cretica]|uniref:Aminotransferase-like plant mobile domain-containing protein n=1 Tax=Brassica cretica TaxID=69181 RepID=A0ABQ7EBH0_BRACR|nr:hypothetical protein DY000_02025220 [Brassica cretica]
MYEIDRFWFQRESWKDRGLEDPVHDWNILWRDYAGIEYVCSPSPKLMTLSNRVWCWSRIEIGVARAVSTWEDLTGTAGAEELSMMIETNSSSKLYNSSGHGELVVGQRSSVKPLANFGSRERRDQFLASWEDRGPEDPVHYWVYGVWSCRFVRSGLELAEYGEEDEDSLSVSDASMRYTKSKAFS